MRKSLLTFVLTLFTGVLFAQQPTRVDVAEGTLEGINLSGIKTFKGVPFAAPPVGNLRWKAPQPVEKWQGVRQAKEFGPNPMQENIFGDMNFGTKKMSEDCLYLNIWTPAKKMDEHLPVLIYFNGGGLMAGSGSEPRYAGDAMARKGIISVTANYREGIFGFFAHPQLSKETSYKGSGNYGFLDQVAAIKWIKDNIAAFGGDPNRITIVGESAGSMSVSALMASPLCQGLFAQAMGSSGSVIGMKKVATLKEAETKGLEITKKIGCKDIKGLRALPAEELMKKASVKSVPIYNIDGYFWTKQPYDVFADGEQTKVPLLIGGNNQEMNAMSLLYGKALTVENLKNAVKATFGDATDELFSLYGLNTDADHMEVWQHAQAHRRTARLSLPLLSSTSRYGVEGQGCRSCRRRSGQDIRHSCRSQEHWCRTLCRHRVCHGHIAHKPRVRLAAGRLRRVGHLQQLLCQLCEDWQS